MSMDRLKLRLLYRSELPLRHHPGVVGLSAVLPGAARQAVLFGWASTNGLPLRPPRHWITQVGPDGAVAQWLPEDLDQHHADQVAWTGGTQDCNRYIRALRSGDAIGLLLGLHELHWFDPHRGALRKVPIHGLPADARWVPLRIGHGHQHQHPVVLAAPGEGYFDGRHLALLQADPEANEAHWHWLRDGQPVTLDEHDYAPLLHRSAWTPLVYALAWNGTNGLFYVGPQHTLHHRGGMPPSALGQHGGDLRLQHILHQAGEASFGELTRCGQWLILSPYHKSGPRKGRQTLVHLQDGRVLEPVPPRGHAGWQVVDHLDGCWWLLPMGLHYGAQEILACAEG